MNRFFFQIKNSSKNNNNKAIFRYKYLVKNDIFLRKLCYYCSSNIPLWCDGDIEFYWKIVDIYERSNARLFKEIKFHLPIDLNLSERIQILEEFCDVILGDNFTYSCAIYEKIDEQGFLVNSYSNIIFNQRIIDEHLRTESTYFKRFNPKNNKLGGAKKDTLTNSKSWLNKARGELIRIINSHLPPNNILQNFFPGK